MADPCTPSLAQFFANIDEENNAPEPWDLTGPNAPYYAQPPPQTGPATSDEQPVYIPQTQLDSGTFKLVWKYPLKFSVQTDLGAADGSTTIPLAIDDGGCPPVGGATATGGYGYPSGPTYDPDPQSPSQYVNSIDYPTTIGTGTGTTVTLDPCYPDPCAIGCPSRNPCICEYDPCDAFCNADAACNPSCPDYYACNPSCPEYYTSMCGAP